MEKTWTSYAVYSIIQIFFVMGVWEERTNVGEDIYVLPGSDVNLTCQTQKKAFVIQMQWSKVTNKVNLIALYHPQHGFYCGSKKPCDTLVAFRETPDNVLKWTLHLRNVSSSLSGKYECSFTLYPEGTWIKIYNLLIQKHVAPNEWQSSHTIEIETNQTLKIPCFQNISSEISSAFTFTWLAEKNGTQKTIITQDHIINNFTFFKDRIKLGTDYELCLSPVQIGDDDWKFSCHATVRPGNILRSTTTVKVFAKPEIPVIAENNSMDGLGKRTFTCSVKNVFPTANLTWFLDGESLQGEKEAIYITNEERKDKGGYLELKSVLTKVFINETAQMNNLTIWCKALFPVPGNKVWSLSSEKIYFSLGSVTPPTDPPPNVMESTLTAQSYPASSISSTRYPATSSITPVVVSTSTRNSTSQTSNSSVTTQGFNHSWTSRGKDDEQTVSWIPSETYRLSSSGAESTLHGKIFTSTTRISKVPTTAHGFTKNNHIYISGTEINKHKDGMPWPVTVATLLFFCMVCFGLGLRKWCQYQKEIMERPPPFKPPPPPIKYTCIQEPMGSHVPYHEMETL
ncbi:PREDICTED: T-cell surface protein tactile isoform X2 [Chrysochloris asiatica]|uniref:T-cell surface protein tactile isoform X2 n=1 Tax=Chrysochloris asiatica TaxID=185453 RepID=A0A9B0TKL6_CHRAS|nr:PREDICTED: T-cell surface protein tactile isoform X2 [Chrysochloris asiatica]